jgi:hypothetical protein
MREFEEGLVAFLTAKPEVREYLGDRISGSVARQGELEAYATYQMITAVDGYHMRGHDGTARLSYQLDIWSTDHDEARDAAETVAELLRGYRGWLGGCRVQKLKASIGGAGDEPDDDGSDTTWHYRRIDLEADVLTNKPDRPPGFTQKL